MDELVRGVFKPESVAYFQRVIGGMKDAGCDAVVFGCTEIPLLMNRLEFSAAGRSTPRACSRGAARAPERCMAQLRRHKESTDALLSGASRNLATPASRYPSASCCSLPLLTLAIGLVELLDRRRADEDRGHRLVADRKAERRLDEAPGVSGLDQSFEGPRAADVGAVVRGRGDRIKRGDADGMTRPRRRLSAPPASTRMPIVPIPAASCARAEEAGEVLGRGKPAGIAAPALGLSSVVDGLRRNRRRRKIDDPVEVRCVAEGGLCRRSGILALAPQRLERRHDLRRVRLSAAQRPGRNGRPGRFACMQLEEIAPVAPQAAAGWPRATAVIRFSRCGCGHPPGWVNLVLRKISGRSALRTRPRFFSDSPSPYAAAVSKKLIPRSSARATAFS